ncbi:6-bladed beta-propeller [Dinghuibacter silviterrae]|uniref:6-bladed beta-propeller protein n=1 Tax=Dinghuibacter silviterrae TaxID=1539049 RepID=A0A4R8DSV8_9BACT|nr:6-bladed beta-propeller [Dinghuibacter silviterrae]TDX00495.1 6-bladed beta-propeller protein [Dinghuibacter silviterrae]
MLFYIKRIEGLALMLIFVLLGCKGNKNHVPSPMVILHVTDSSTSWQSSDRLSDLITPIRFVPLERSEVANIGNVDKLLAIDDKFYILDKSSAKCVFIFSSDGKYLGTIGSPTSYKLPNDITYDAANRELWVLDGGNRKILRYSLEGNYHGDILLDFYCENFEFHGTGVGFIGGRQEDDLLLADTTGKKLTSDFPMNAINCLRLVDPLVKSDDTTAFFREYLNDTIYRIKDDWVYPAFYVDFGTHKFIPPKTTAPPGLHVLIPPASSMGQINHFLVSPSFVTFSFQYQGKALYAIYDRASKKLKTYSRSANNDLTFDKYPPYSIAARRDTFYALVQPYSLIPSLKNWSLDNAGLDSSEKLNLSRMIGISNGMTELSNPVIMAFTFNHL